MLLILARHGNTFGPGDTPVWVGAKEDLPLTEAGLEQSRMIGRAIRDANLGLDRIISGPLKRTRTGAALIAEHCGYTGEIDIDDRLREIDYGIWGGKSDAEIVETWGQSAIDDWRDRSIPPKGAGWSPSARSLESNAKKVYAYATKDLGDEICVLVMTSNGILRYFYDIVAGKQAPRELAKVKTGHCCVIHIDRNGPVVRSWNEPPQDALNLAKVNTSDRD